MTAYVMTALRCDAERCRAKFPPDGKPMHGDWTWVRSKAAAAGWTSRAIRPAVDDLCPEQSDESGTAR